MRVAFIVDRFPAVSQTFIFDQVTGLLDLGVEIEVFARYSGSEETADPDLEDHPVARSVSYFGAPHGYTRRLVTGIKIATRLAMARPSALLGALNVSRWGKKALSLEQLYLVDGFTRSGSLDFDIVHAHFGPSGNVALALGELLGLGGKLVTSFYGHDVSQAAWTGAAAPPPSPPSPPSSPYAALFAAGDSFVALSEHMRGRLESIGCPPERIIKLPLCVDTEKFGFKPGAVPRGRPIVLLTVARLVEKKGVEYCLEAVARTMERLPDLVYRIAGDGPLRASLEARSRELGIAGKVSFLGAVEHAEVRRELDSADVFLLASVTAADGDQEGTPTVLLEAQAIGLPVISTLHAGIPEIVEDGAAGYLVPERDVDALTDALAKLLSAPERWAAMGHAGRRFVELNHEKRRIALKLEAEYARLAASPAGEAKGTVASR